MSTDGFNLFHGHGARTVDSSCWSVTFMVLNYSYEHRFCAINCLHSTFLPGSHASDYFFTFLDAIIEDLHRLRHGIQVRCADGKVRSLRCEVMFITGDIPTISKLCGMMGHSSYSFCRCSKRRLV